MVCVPELKAILTRILPRINIHRGDITAHELKEALAIDPLRMEERNERDTRKERPLMTAARHGNVAVVQFLLSIGVSVDSRDIVRRWYRFWHLKKFTSFHFFIYWWPQTPEWNDFVDEGSFQWSHSNCLCVNKWQSFCRSNVKSEFRGTVVFGFIVVVHIPSWQGFGVIHAGRKDSTALGSWRRKCRSCVNVGQRWSKHRSHRQCMCIYVCVYICVYVCVYICVYVCMYVCVCVFRMLSWSFIPFADCLQNSFNLCSRKWTRQCSAGAHRCWGQGSRCHCVHQ